MIETINKTNRISRQILQETGQEPDPTTLAVKMEMPEDKIRRILKIGKEPISNGNADRRRRRRAGGVPRVVEGSDGG